MAARRKKDEGRIGRQRPTKAKILSYTKSKGTEAVKLYNQAPDRKSMKWQTDLLKDIMAVEKDGSWTHLMFGYSIPRRNGKNEILVMRELWGLTKGEKILHTAHRTATSHSAWVRLVDLMKSIGYVEFTRYKQGEEPPENGFRTNKQFGLETIEMAHGGGVVSFRTRTDSGGLGEGYDLLIIDEAQEYTEAQRSTLLYVVSASENPQTILTGTPPTAVSSGSVFKELREKVFNDETEDTGWAEWSIESEPPGDSYKTDIDSWYETNPSLGIRLRERTIRSTELQDDRIDFIIQRLGYWYSYSLAALITEDVWTALQADSMPELTGKLAVGIKYGKDGKDVSLSIAARTADGRFFIESIDCRPQRIGSAWLLSFIREIPYSEVLIDGQQAPRFIEDMEDLGLKNGRKATVPDVVNAADFFLQSVTDKEVTHMGQPSLTQSVTNCERRPIGNQGGWGFKSLKDEISVTLIESAALALYSCHTGVKKPKRKQKASC